MLRAIWIHFTVICIFWNSFSIFRFTFEIVKHEPLPLRGRSHLMTATVLLLRSDIWLDISKISLLIVTGITNSKNIITRLQDDLPTPNEEIIMQKKIRRHEAQLSMLALFYREKSVNLKDVYILCRHWGQFMSTS